ncbi:MAG: hypothetical protein LC104_20990 [Bacteroidales bacterium]|nr:hypothetical protein [Bacteroidales bacterium]
MNGPKFAATLTDAPGVPTTAPRPTMPRPPVRSAKPKTADGGDAAAVLRILTYLRLHWLMIAFCGLFLGTALACIAYSLLPAKYESYALLQVASSPTSIAQQNDPTRSKSDFVTYLKTTAQLIKSEFVLNSAMSDTKYKIADLPTLKEQDDPIKYLDEKLQVVYSEGSEVIRVVLEGKRPDDIRKIVDAVKDAYYREVVEKEIQQKATFRLKVEQARAALEDLMRMKVGKTDHSPHIVGLAGDPTLPQGPLPPLPAATGGGIPVASTVQPAAAIAEPEAARKARFNVTLQRIFGLETQIQQFPIILGEKTVEVESLRKQIDALRTGPASQESIAAAEHDPEVMELANRAKVQSDTARYLATVVTNPNSERVLRAKEQAELMDQKFKQAREEKARIIETARRQDEANKLFALLDTAQRDLRNIQERERLTKSQLETARKELNEIPPDAIKPEAEVPLVDPVKTDLMTHNDMYRLLTAQLISLGFELDSPPRVRKLQDASVPSQKDSKKQILGTAFAGMMGFVLIALGVVAFETMNRRVSSLGELTASGPSTVVGVIPWMPDGSTAKDPIKRADVNEAIDKLRSYVAQTWLSRGATTVSVTSPIGDEGKAFTAFGLASSLAQAGYKTLLLDFDLRTPTLHQFAGVSNGVGVCELLRGEFDFRRAVQSLPSGLQFVSAGKWSDEARQAAVGDRLETLLTRLKEPFDCVVLHGTALLTVAESVEIARRSEVVLLCSLYRDTRLPMLTRAAERIASMEVPYSGIVYLGATRHEALC